MAGAALLLNIQLCRAANTADYLGPSMPYTEFDAMPTSTIEVSGAQLEIGIAPGGLGQRRQTVFAWITDSTRAITTYFGRFPVQQLRILIVPVSGDQIHGTTWGYRGAATRLTLGKSVHDVDVIHSWVLAHEMVHVAFPQIPHEHLWLEEGLATYVEPIARAQANLAPPEHVWRHFLWGMPHERPQAGDRGLDQTHTWGRTYWGGALFCLLADIEIRSRTENRRSLQDALRAIVEAGGNNEVDWPLAQVLAVADAAAAVPVLAELYDRMRASPVDTDLDSLWRRLGVAVKDGSVIFDDTAPLAGIRPSQRNPVRAAETRGIRCPLVGHGRHRDRLSGVTWSPGPFSTHETL